jgi:hypothetical protein
MGIVVKKAQVKAIIRIVRALPQPVLGRALIDVLYERQIMSGYISTIYLQAMTKGPAPLLKKTRRKNRTYYSIPSIRKKRGRRGH